ncbi:MAG: hypothetical protein Q7T95_27705 [Hydrogenophaga sp.]|nr:hypothetical protein [Hydrogenophaga sp.]
MIIAMLTAQEPPAARAAAASSAANDVVVVRARVVRPREAAPVPGVVAPPKASMETRSHAVKSGALPAANHVSAADSGSSNAATSDAIQYFERDALDRAAEPVGEWTIDTSLLPPTGECTFEVSIWISAKGEIEKWEATSASLAEDVTASIFARLNDTVMNPALIGTKPVASVLRFELSAERQ